MREQSEKQITRILEVSFDILQQAMEDVSRDRFDYYFDLESGLVIPLSQKIMNDSISSLYSSEPDDSPGEDVLIDSEINISAELSDDAFDRLETNISVLLDPERFIRVSERNSTEAYQCMRLFSDGIENNDLKTSLLDILNGNHPFSEFKQLLTKHPRERKRWHSFNAKQMRTVIRNWLEDQGIKPIRKRKDPS